MLCISFVVLMVDDMDVKATINLLTGGDVKATINLLTGGGVTMINV